MACKVVAHGEEARRVEAGSAQGGGWRWGLTVVRPWRRGGAGVEGHTGRSRAPPHYGRARERRGKKGRGMTSGSYVSDQFFLKWSRGIDGETVGSPTL